MDIFVLDIYTTLTDQSWQPLLSFDSISSKVFSVRQITRQYNLPVYDTSPSEYHNHQKMQRMDEFDKILTQKQATFTNSDQKNQLIYKK